MTENKKPPGRPARPMPPPINDTPENVARAILSTPPKPPGDWKYLREWKRRKG